VSYLIDGHNLIPKIAGLSLRSLDDELRLVEMLQVYCRVRRQRVEVFFDQAAPGHAGRKQFGMVVAHFVRQGRTADESIVARLDQLDKAARNWKVVSSDHQVQAEARIRLAGIVPSEQFAAELQAALRQAQETPSGSGPDKTMEESELAEWLKLFGE
jgi:predicted RNA-binding protein with PIN domain